MKKIHYLPNIVTAFGLACGLFVIFKVNMIQPGSGDYEMLLQATLLLLVAALADFIDGALARAISAESEFGLLFDSLADTVSFGVAPSVLFLKGLSLEQGTPIAFFSAASAMVFSLCAILRLVRFSVAKPSSKKPFIGLPVPAAAAASVSANLFFLSPDVQGLRFFEYYTRGALLSFIMIFLGYCMVSKWRFPSVKFLRFPIPSFSMVFFSAVLAVSILYAILHFFSILLAVLSWAYVLISLLLSIIRKCLGKKSKALKSFEPDESFDEFYS